jgi:predicted enzyme related to lactoylglutathione lyase
VDLNSIMIGSEDPQRLVDYYTKLLGEPSWSDSGYTGWSLGSGSMMVGPHDQVKGSNAEPGRLIWNMQTPDVKGEFERLTAAGATVVQEPYSPGGNDNNMLLCTFADPDGNYFQLASPMDL